jgi:hypothetical protein
MVPHCFFLLRLFYTLNCAKIFVKWQTAKLKKENSELREVALLNVKLSQVTKDFDKKIDESGHLAEQT